jgi:hypothetical protein
LNINDYAHLKKDLLRLVSEQKGNDIIMKYALVAAYTHVPNIVFAVFMGESLNWPPEIVENIENLTKSYNYTLRGLPESYPGRKA